MTAIDYLVVYPVVALVWTMAGAVCLMIVRLAWYASRPRAFQDAEKMAVLQLAARLAATAVPHEVTRES